MRMKKHGPMAMVLVVCLVMTLALGSITALAVDLDTVALTVKAADNFANEAEENDFNEAGVVVDLYQVADAAPVEGYDTYEFVYSTAPYNGLDAEKDWSELAQDAARLTFDNDLTPAVADVAVGSTVDRGLSAGLYLVIARGANDADYIVDGDTITTIARSAASEYTFAPQLIALPTKTDVNEDGSVTTAEDDGEWINDPTLLLKYSQAQRFGSLTINKTVPDFEGDAATFVFSIEAARNGEVVYSNVAAVQYSGQPASVTVDKVPAGTAVTVAEIYSGQRFSVVGSGVQTVEEFSATETNEVSFTNSYNGSAVTGHGIQNHFEYSETVSWSLDQQK